MGGRILTDAQAIQELEELTFKAHRVTDFTFALANTWTDIEWDDEVIEESLTGINYKDADTTPDKTIIVLSTNKIVSVGGCIRPEFTGASPAAVLIGIRVMLSDNEGSTWTEAR